MQLELFDLEPIEPPMRMIVDTLDVQIGGKSPAEAIAAIKMAEQQLPEGSSDPILEIRGNNDSLHQVCRLIYRRPQTDDERQLDRRYRRPRLHVVAS